MAHLAAVLKGESTHLGNRTGHNHIDERCAALEGTYTDRGEGLGHLDDAQVRAAVERAVADVEHGGGQFHPLDADTVGKSFVGNAGNHEVLVVVPDGTRNAYMTAQQLGVLKVIAYVHLAVVDYFIIKHLSRGTDCGKVGLLVGLGK